MGYNSLPPSQDNPQGRNHVVLLISEDLLKTNMLISRLVLYAMFFFRDVSNIFTVGLLCVILSAPKPGYNLCACTCLLKIDWTSSFPIKISLHFFRHWYIYLVSQVYNLVDNVWKKVEFDLNNIIFVCWFNIMSFFKDASHIFFIVLNQFA